MPLQSIASGSNGSPALGRWLSHPPPPPRREPARRAMKHGRRAQGYNDRPGVFARPAATVASGVNPLEQRPSLPAATADRRSARPSSTARMARARSPLKAAFSDQRSAFSLVFAGASHPSSVAATQRADGRHVRRRGAVQSQGLRPRGRTLLAVAGRAVADPAIAAPKCLAHWTGGCANRHRTPGNSCPKQKRAHDFRDVAAIRRG
jgi:hypothetical protein